MAEKELKKRKRQSNGVDTPNKKVAFDSTSASGSGDKEQIKVSYVNDDASRPALLSAPGVNAPKVPLKAYAKAHVAKDNTGPVQPRTHALLLHSSQHPRLDYTASPTTLDEGLSHYLAIFDPSTKELKITPAHSLSLRSTLRSELQEVEQAKLSNAQKREELGREFGTKKAKKAILSKTENAIVSDSKGKAQVTDVQSAILESVGDATAGAASRNAEQEADTLLASKPIPKPNLAAEKVEDVYSYNTLLPPGDARLLNIKDWKAKIDADEEIILQHQYPANRIKRTYKADDIPKMKALAYLALLLEFHDACSTSRGSKKVPKREILAKKLSAWPAQLVDSVRKRFADSSGQSLGKWQLDNMYTHICALALYVDAWVTDTGLLKEDLKMETSQLSKYFLELGCKISAPTETERNVRGMNKATAAVTKMAKLRLPLEFPKPRQGRRK